MTASTATASVTHLPNAFSIGLKRAGIEIRQLVRDREAAVFTFIFPVLLLVVFGLIFNQDIGNGVKFSQYFVAGMIASGVFYTGFQNLSITIPQERDDGTLKRLEGTPMPKSSYFIGKIGVVLVAYIAQVILLIVVGKLAFGFDIPSQLSQWVTFAWVSALGLTCCVLLGLAFSSVPKTGKGAPAIVTPIVLILQFTSGVFFIYNQLPTWLQHVASVFPLKWMVQGMQSVFLPDSFASDMTGANSDWQLGRVAIVLAVWTIAAAILAGATFRWRRRGDN